MDLSPTVMTDDLCLTFGFFFFILNMHQIMLKDLTCLLQAMIIHLGSGPLDSQISPMEALPVTFSALVK